jgi:hypothetical protein
MWVRWLERTLEAHDAADYAAQRACRPALDDAPPPWCRARAEERRCEEMQELCCL